MKPSGVIIENYFDTSSDEETSRASIVMSPDTPDGFFFSPPTGGNRVELRVTLEDAIHFQKTKSENVRQRILDTYIVPVPNSDKFAFPHGALIGDIAVGGVLEVNGPAIKRTDKKS